MAAAAGPGHAPELIAKEVAFGNGQIRKGGNTLTIEAVAPAPGFTECFFGLDAFPGRPGQDGRKTPAKP